MGVFESPILLKVVFTENEENIIGKKKILKYPYFSPYSMTVSSAKNSWLVLIGLITQYFL